MARDLKDDSRRRDETRKHLDSKHVELCLSLAKGPFLQHNYLVSCGEGVCMLNPENDQSERFWRIFPTGGSFSRAGDACAIAAWWFMLVFPIIPVVVAGFSNRTVKIVCTVLVGVVLSILILLIYLTVKNDKKFCRLWCVAKVNKTEFLGWKSVVKEVTLETLRDMEYLLTSKKYNGVLYRLAKMNNRKVSVLLCMNSFGSHHVIYPIISLLLLSLEELIALVALLEMTA